MVSLLLQVGFWAAISLIAFGVISYIAFSCPEYVEMEDGRLVRQE